MKTKIWKIDSNLPDENAILEAAKIIRKGGLVAFPTETVYGLGANAFNEKAVSKIFSVKKRPSWDPLIVHVCNLEMLELIVKDIPECFYKLAEHFMPGPLTVVMYKNQNVPDIVTAGLSTIAVRIPDHIVAIKLIEASGVPIAAPSANIFGRPSPTTAEHVLHDLEGSIDGILDAGQTKIGVESTVLDLTKNPPVILRPGGVSKEMLEEVLGKVTIFQNQVLDYKLGLPSPGMMLRHYAPSVPIILTNGNPKHLKIKIKLLKNKGYESRKIGVLAPKGWLRNTKGLTYFEWGSWGNWEELAKRLFEGIHWLEAKKISIIVAPLPPPIGLGLAIRDRLIKASFSEECKISKENSQE